MEWPPYTLQKNVKKCLFQPLIEIIMIQNALFIKLNFFFILADVYATCDILFITFFPILHFKETTDEIIDFLL